MYKFRVVKSSTEIDKKGFYLIHDNWDDWFEYEISYYLWIQDENLKCVGRVKIAEKNQKRRTADLKEEFDKLEASYVSIGFSEEYYENLKTTNYREEILSSLNDIAYNLDLYEEVKGHNVTKISMMREYTENGLMGQINRMALGGAKLTNYDFAYIFPSIDPMTQEQPRMVFEVKREERPFSNIHVLIGKNGVGKTSVIKKMIYAFEKCKKEQEVGFIEHDVGKFTNIVCVSFSAFDTPIFEEDFEEKFTVPYKFVGLIKPRSIKNSASLSEEFVECTYNFYNNASKMMLWKTTIEVLESDQTFIEQEIRSWITDSMKREWIQEVKNSVEDVAHLNSEKLHSYLKCKHRERVYDKFTQLSSGHKIILLTLVNLIDLVEEKTVVFLDEPEEHLHPPLVAAFIQALSKLLIYRNGVGIVATHSPVIVQEVPKKCVWILERQGTYLVPRRPEIETFGENLGELTTEIFRYEVTNSGFHKELRKVVEDSDTFEQAKDIFNNQLGKEAKSILRAYMYDKRG